MERVAAARQDAKHVAVHAIPQAHAALRVAVILDSATVLGELQHARHREVTPLEAPGLGMGAGVGSPWP